MEFLAGIRSEPPRRAALGANGPEIAFGGENDGIARNGGEAIIAGTCGSGTAGVQGEEKEERKERGKGKKVDYATSGVRHGVLCAQAEARRGKRREQPACG